MQYYSNNNSSCDCDCESDSCECKDCCQCDSCELDSCQCDGCGASDDTFIVVVIIGVYIAILAIPILCIVLFFRYLLKTTKVTRVQEPPTQEVYEVNMQAVSPDIENETYY